MTGKLLPRLGLVAALAAALIAAAIEAGRKGDDETKLEQAARSAGVVDVHRQALKRCQDLGEAAIHDATCLKAWAESRRRFLRIETPSRTETPPVPTITAPSDAAPTAPGTTGAIDPIGQLILDTEPHEAP